MARRFYTSFTMDDGQLGEIWIHDSKYNGTSVSNFKLSKKPVVPVGIRDLKMTRDSQIELEIQRAEENILEMIEEGDQNQFSVEWRANDDYWYRGYVIHGESTRHFREYSDVEKNKGTLQASDIGYLNHTLFTLDGKERGARYEGEDSVANIIGKCFAKIDEDLVVAMGTDLFYSAGNGGSWAGIEALEGEWLDQRLFRGEFGVFSCNEVLKTVLDAHDMYLSWDGGRYFITPMSYMHLGQDQVRIAEYRVSHDGAGRVGYTWFRQDQIDDSLHQFSRLRMEPDATVETEPPKGLVEQKYDYIFEQGTPAIFTNGDFKDHHPGSSPNGHTYPNAWTDPIDDSNTWYLNTDNWTTFAGIKPNIDLNDYIYPNNREIEASTRAERLYQESNIEIYPSGPESYLELVYSYRHHSEEGLWALEDFMVGPYTQGSWNSIDRWYKGELEPEISLNVTVRADDGTVFYLRRRQLFVREEVNAAGEGSVLVYPIAGETNAILRPKGATVYFPKAKIVLSEPFRYNDERLVGEISVITEASQNPRYREAGIIYNPDGPVIDRWQNVEGDRENYQENYHKAFSYAICLTWETTPTMTVEMPDAGDAPGWEAGVSAPTLVAFPMTPTNNFIEWNLHAPLYTEDGTEVSGVPRIGINTPVKYKPLRGDNPDLATMVNWADLIYSAGESGAYEGETSVVMVNNDSTEDMKLEDARIGQGPTSAALSAIRPDPRVYPEGRAANWYEARLDENGEWDHASDYDRDTFINQVIKRRLRAFHKPVRLISATVSLNDLAPLTPMTRLQPVEWSGSKKWMVPWDVIYHVDYNTLEGTWRVYDYEKYEKSDDPNFEFLSVIGSVAGQPYGSIRDVFGGSGDGRTGGTRTGGDRTPRTGDAGDPVADGGSGARGAGGTALLSIATLLADLDPGVEYQSIVISPPEDPIQAGERLQLVDAFDQTHTLKITVAEDWDGTGTLATQPFTPDPNKNSFPAGSAIIRAPGAGLTASNLVPSLNDAFDEIDFTVSSLSADYDGTSVHEQRVDHVAPDGTTTTYAATDEPALPEGYERELWSFETLSHLDYGTTGFALTNSGQVAINEAVHVRIFNENGSYLTLADPAGEAHISYADGELDLNNWLVLGENEIALMRSTSVAGDLSVAGNLEIAGTVNGSPAGNMIHTNLYVDEQEPSGQFKDYDLWIQPGSGLHQLFYYWQGAWEPVGT